MNKYEVRKIVEASSISDAFLKEKKVSPQCVMLVEEDEEEITDKFVGFHARRKRVVQKAGK